MSGESVCTCGRDRELLCRACDVEVCDECLQLPKARAEIARLRAALEDIQRYPTLSPAWQDIARAALLPPEE